MRFDPAVLPAEVVTRLRNRLEQSGRVDAVSPHFLSRIETFVRMLALWGARINLTARSDDPGELVFHILDSLAPLTVANHPGAASLAEAFAAGRRVLDMGSGSGFPGLVLSAATSAHFSLTESRRKRASFLKVAAAEIGLDNVIVLENRLEPAQITPVFDVVVARAFATPVDLYALAAQTLRTGGKFVLYASRSQRLNPAAATDAGLGGYARFAYELEHGDKLAQRILAVWIKL